MKTDRTKWTLFMLFDPPQFNKRTLYHIYNANNAIIEKLKKNIPLNTSEEKDLKSLPATYLICFLNDFIDAKDKLMESKPFLKKQNGSIYNSYKETARILRKMKYR